MFRQVNFIVAACENMISGDGMRPGDILTASNGKTIEVKLGGKNFFQFLTHCKLYLEGTFTVGHVHLQVNNTDAEGRLTLADALVYAGNLGVDKVCSLTIGSSCLTPLRGDSLNSRCILK